MNNILSRIKTINCALKSSITLSIFTCFCVLFRKCNHCFYFFICYIFRSCTSNLKCNVMSFRINQISCRSRNLFKIYNLLCLIKCHFRCTLFICCRHFFDKLCTSWITINTIYGTCKRIRCFSIFLYNRYRTFLCPSYFEIYIFFTANTFSKYKCKILCGRTSANLIGCIFFINTSSHGCIKSCTHIFCLSKRSC